MGKDRTGIIYIYSSKNDTIMTSTDVSGSETLTWASGGMMVESSREEGKPYAAMRAAQKITSDLKEKGITHVIIRIRGQGGNKAKSPGSGAQAAIRMISRSGLMIKRIEDVTPLPTDSMRKKGGRRGRRV
ncbi:MAG: 30S ribosomal protein S11 [Candidatus Micrarchaeota archaeon]|nr:30S ribosomal protein S11 [Candidatus Micrarchaeota archaeon]